MKESEEKSKEQKRYYIPVDGKYYETTKEIYEVYYQMDRRERYLEERDIKKGVKTFSDISSFSYTADEIIGDDELDVSDKAIKNIYIEAVLEALSYLDEEDQSLIQELFFYGKTEREVANDLVISKTALHFRKNRALERIRNQLNF
ncbi:sigma-70 RNA polymerase sigma factor region 4 domain-containing protein [Fusibacter tunisiensis]|jgi:DNA-directed RNA polymerase specialized sigma subunit|uniref:DNA-directed RNA polymerase specialized sigma subunit n=1 Tax=Fusibacter tunisiensis TaxID=1008308 RepID=A0ABS2MSZ4_9FIRM|nr:sigma-70 family RNA polymerase sigma factor [Fusibacter tunisiensis]MBM7562519.1 DNA-directed RNA polymerase specialized sigma subunit [Fusibacter tunisiensis]